MPEAPAGGPRGWQYLIDGQVALSKAGQPTTQILKPFVEGLDGTVENEIFWVRLADRVGLPVPKVSRGAASNIDYFLIERYDRLTGDDGTITRPHQEELCQAPSVPPELKYEDEGGPGIAKCQSLIADHNARPAADRLTFLRMVIFQYLVGNADAHAKKYSLLYRENTPDLAPPRAGRQDPFSGHHPPLFPDRRILSQSDPQAYYCRCGFQRSSRVSTAFISALLA